MSLINIFFREFLSNYEVNDYLKRWPLTCEKRFGFKCLS